MTTTPNRPSSPRDVLQLIKKHGIEFVDCRFMDFPGAWQHQMYSAASLDATSMTTGFGFDGSCIRGWEAINEGDMLLVPVLETARVDPFYEHPTLAVICDIKDPVTKKQYSRDPRSIARKAAAFLQKSGIADQAMFSPEMEFFIFDRVRYDQTMNSAHYSVDSREGIWNRGKDDPTNLGNQIRAAEGYFPVPPIDTLAELRSEMALALQAMGIVVDSHHHEVATGGQCEIALRHQDLLGMADTCMIYKYVVKNVAARHGRVATFMPKPLFGDNGSGMHTHLSLWKGGKPLLPGRHYAGLSQLGLHAIGGILKHGRALCALTNPTTNSYKRLVPGFEAPVNLSYSSRNRWSAIRIPVYGDDPKTKRMELRFPDCACNPYLAFSAILMAAIDGIKNQIDPGDPVDVDIRQVPAERLASLASAPASLAEALHALEHDHAFLLEGGVFTEDLIRYWIKYKRDNEVAELRHRPHPHEFNMYFDI
jgi:glutamine synthetase